MGTASARAELSGQHLAGETFFQELQEVLSWPDSNRASDVLEVLYLCLLLGFKGRYATGGDLSSMLAAVREKVHRTRSKSAPLSPCGAVSSESIRFTGADPWARKLTAVAVSISGLAFVAFLLFKLLLANSLSDLSSSAAGILK